MIELNETTLGVAFAVLGLISTVVMFGLALYGIKSLQDVRDALRDLRAAEGR